LRFSQLERIWGARLLIGLVLLINLLCAGKFLTSPERFIGGFELIGDIGIAVVRGIGILFLMWNVPYLVAFFNPLKRIISLYEAIVMQAIGLIGESWISASLSGTHSVIQASLHRFILFDALGLAALFLAACIANRPEK
jgi:hypothetical protein